MSLRHKRILITAGPTWVAIDDVRVLSNVSSGRMGCELAQEACRRGWQVELFMGPVGDVALHKNIKFKRFVYFQELQELITKALKDKRYDAVIHCAAVSDYLTRPVKGKISSKKNELVIRLRRAPKIINRIRKLSPDSFLIMFKLECGISDQCLLKRAKEALKNAKADLVVANTVGKKGYKGFILDSDGILARGSSRQVVAKELFKFIGFKL